MSEFYNHYMVLGSKMTVIFNYHGDQHVNVGIALSDDYTNTYTDYHDMIEQKRGVFRTLNKHSCRMAITQKFSTKKYFDLKDLKDNQGRYGAPVNQNPNEDAFYLIYAETETGETVTMRWTVIIDYIIRFYEPKELGPS